MLMGAVMGGLDDSFWLANGGNATLASYGGSLAKIPSDHLGVLSRIDSRITKFDDTIFVHASYDPEVEMFDQSETY